MRVCGAILVEKPLARSAAEADQLLQVQHQTGARVLVAYPRRFRNHYVAARHWIENGEIGAFRYGAMEWCDVHMGSYLGTGDSGDRTFRDDPAAAVHGVLLDHGSHMLDSFLWLTGQRITAVSATLRFGSKGLDCAALLSLEIGDVGLASAIIYPAQSGRQERRISVQGTAGRIVIDDETAALYRGRSHTELVAHAPEELRLTESYLAMLANEPSAGCDLRQGCDVVRVIDAAYRSFDHDVAVHL
jgi:predicted dehydrogenase